MLPGDLFRPDHDPDHPPPASLHWGAAHGWAHRRLWHPQAVCGVHHKNILSAGKSSMHLRHEMGLQSFQIINHVVKLEVTFVFLLVCPQELAVGAF